MLFLGIAHFIPHRILTLLWEYAPGAGVKKLRKNREEVHKVAKQLLKDKQENDSGSKDVMSLLGLSRLIREAEKR